MNPIAPDSKPIDAATGEEADGASRHTNETDLKDQDGIDFAAISGIPAIPAILKVVCRTTGMGFATVARVTEENWTACEVLDAIGFGLEPGGQLAIETTICREVRKTRTEVVIEDVAEDPEYRDHATPALYGFRS